MNVNRFLFCACLLIGLPLVHADGNSTDAPNYDVNRVAGATPAIDGIVNEGEWDAATAAAGDWVDLRTHLPDEHNLRFRMLWDDENLYILGETDWDGFNVPQDSLGNPNISGATYNPNFYFDPNNDDEVFAERLTADAQPDGYQIAWSVEQGFSSRRPTPGAAGAPLRDPIIDGEFVNDYLAGLYAEAHVDTAFGNNGAMGGVDNNDGPNANWRDDELPGLVFAMNADNADVNGTGVGGGVWEFAIAWDVFNATDPNRLLQAGDGSLVDPASDSFLGAVGDPDPRYADPESEFFVETGLYAVDGPEPGDVWGFETGVISNDPNNFLPSWSEPQGGDAARESFAPWGLVSGHGRLTFIQPEPVCDPDTGGDTNGDGMVSFPDFLILSSNFAKEVIDHTEGDFNCDGTVNFPDFLVMSANFGKTVGASASAASVPEPSSIALLLIGLVAVIRRRR